jgi:hypothetical protein
MLAAYLLIGRRTEGELRLLAIRQQRELGFQP